MLEGGVLSTHVWGFLDLPTYAQDHPPLATDEYDARTQYIHRVKIQAQLQG
jgi:hypothetical protein